jgi:hypothetical protein
MTLLITYIITLLLAQSLSVGVGLLVDQAHSSHAGLLAFLVLYFAMFVVAWKIAVRITEPRSSSPAA